MSPSAAAEEGQYLLQDLQAKYIVNIVHKQMTTAGAASAALPPSGSVQGRAKLMELSLVMHVPSGPIGFAWAGHFACNQAKV